MQDLQENGPHSLLVWETTCLAWAVRLEKNLPFDHRVMYHWGLINVMYPKIWFLNSTTGCPNHMDSAWGSFGPEL